MKRAELKYWLSAVALNVLLLFFWFGVWAVL